jgi:hypothetical protein
MILRTTLRTVYPKRTFATVSRQFSNDYVYNGMLAGTVGLIASGIPTAVQAMWVRNESLKGYLSESLAASGNLIFSADHSRELLVTSGLLTDMGVSIGAGVLIAYLTRPDSLAEPMDTTSMVLKCAGIAVALHSVNLFLLPSALNAPLMNDFIRHAGVGSEMLDFAAHGAAVGATLAYIQNRGIPMMSTNMAWSGTGPSGGSGATTGKPSSSSSSSTYTPPGSTSSSSSNTTGLGNK